MAELIRVTGLKEFRRDLRRLDKSLPKGIRVAGNEAAKIVVGAAKPRIPSGPPQGGHVTSSLKAASTSSAARVSFGSKAFPYAAWLDFGGRVGRRHSVHRPFLKEGRYVWAAFADNRGKVKKVLRDELSKLARDAGLGGI